MVSISGISRENLCSPAKSAGTEAKAIRTTIAEVAEYICSFQPHVVPASTQRAARRCLLDYFGAAIAGCSHSAAVSGRKAASALFPGSSATAFGVERPLSVLGAAFCNSMAASALDVDDGHRLACGHPGAAVIPAVWAVAEEVRARDEDILAAITLGYEIGIRIAAARRRTAGMSISTGRWAGIGVAAATGWLRNIDAHSMANALAIAEVLAPNQLAADLSGYQEGETKEGVPWAVVTGLVAVSLAESSVSGYLGALDRTELYAPLRLAQTFDDFLIETVYFKPYGCCRWIHSAVDALLFLTKENVFRSEDIDQIVVHTFAPVANLNNLPDPLDLTSAQFSMPHVLATVAVHGVSALLPLVSVNLRRPEVADLARRVVITVDPEIDRHYPAATPCRLTVKTRRGIFETTADHASGDAVAPLSDDELAAKFRVLCGPRLTADRQENLLETIQGRRDSLLHGVKAALN